VPSSSSSSSSSSGSKRRRPKGLVVEAPSGVKALALYRALRSASDVEKVVQDRIISIAQSECLQMPLLQSSAVSGLNLQASTSPQITQALLCLLAMDLSQQKTAMLMHV
jgi:hypothetical protein